MAAGVSAFDLFGEIVVETSKAQKSMKDADKKLKKLEKELNKTEKAAKKTGKGTEKAAKGTTKLGRAAAKTSKKIKHLHTGLSKTSALMAGFAGGIAAGAFAAISANVGAGIKSLVAYNAKIETTRIAFESLSGSAKFATDHIKELQTFSTQNALPFDSLLTVSQRLQGAGVQGEKVTEILKDIGNVAAATGEISSDRLNGIATALTQIIGKGKLSAEEMEQLAERGVPAWKLLSESIGKSVAVTRKMAETGKLTAKDILKAFKNSKWGDALAKQAKTGAGAMIAIKNSIQISASNMFKPIYDVVSEFGITFAGKLRSQKPKTGGAFKAFGEAMGHHFRMDLGNQQVVVVELLRVGTLSWT